MNTKEKIISRRFAGICTLASDKSFPLCFAVYEVIKQIKTKSGFHYMSCLERGYSVSSRPDVYSSKRTTRKRKEQTELTCRWDLQTSLSAASILNNQLKEACLRLDESYDMKEF